MKEYLQKMKDFMVITSAAMLTGGVASIMPQIVALAGESSGGGMDFSMDDVISGAGSNSALDPVAKTVQGAGASLYKIVFFAFVFISIIGIVVSAIKIITSNAQSRQEAKSDVVWKAVGALIGFAAIGIITLVAGIGAGLFDADKGGG